MDDRLAEALEEIGRQMAIKNRITLAKELYQMEHYDPYDFVEILTDLEEELT